MVRIVVANKINKIMDVQQKNCDQCCFIAVFFCVVQSLSYYSDRYDTDRILYKFKVAATINTVNHLFAARKKSEGKMLQYRHIFISFW